MAQMLDLGILHPEQQSLTSLLAIKMSHCGRSNYSGGGLPSPTFKSTPSCPYRLSATRRARTSLAASRMDYRRPTSALDEPSQRPGSAGDGIGSSGSNGSSTATSGSGMTRLAPPHRGLQGQTVAHLLGGSFDEGRLAVVPPHTLNWCIKTLGAQGRLDLAQQLFHWMRLRRAANEHSYVKLCEACEAARAPWVALQAWRNVERMQVPFRLGPHSAAALVRTFRAAGDLPGALAALGEVQRRGSLVNQYAYNTVLRLCADLEDVDAALSLLEAMREEGRRHPRLLPDVRTYSAVLLALTATGKWSRTVAVHKLLKEDGVRPDHTLYAQLIACYASAGRPEAAEAVMDAMQDDGLRPNRTHWNALLRSYAEAQRYDGCMDVYRRMTGEGRLRPNTYTLVALLRGAFHARIGHAAAAWATEVMEEFDVPLNVQVGTALICCCRHFDAEREEAAASALGLAASVLEMMRAAGGAATPNIRTYNAFMLVQAAGGDFQGVLETYELVEASDELDANDITWGIAVAACRETEQAERAAALEELRETWVVLHGAH